MTAATSRRPKLKIFGSSAGTRAKPKPKPEREPHVLMAVDAYGREWAIQFFLDDNPTIDIIDMEAERGRSMSLKGLVEQLMFASG